jgi:hypothetical protein
VIRRGRFRDVVRRQLDLFEQEQADLILRADAAARAYRDADRDDAEEHYGDYADVVDEATDELASLRDHYAAALDPELAETYEQEFNRAVLKRFRRFALEIE